MPQGRITVAPAQAADRVLLSMVIGEDEPISAALTPSKIDALIEKIGLARAAMRDRINSDQGALAVLEFTVINSEWRANPNIAPYNAEADSIALGFRHDRYGWLSFVLPDKDARALGVWLVETTRNE